MKNKTSVKQNLINHVAFVLDASSSMSTLRNALIDVFNQQIKLHRERSKETGQETRISVYTFADNVNCLMYDIDVNRVQGIESIYSAGGWTALRDGTLKAIEDAEKIPQIYGDHAFLINVLTDGQENRSKSSLSTLVNKLRYLPENFTLSILVPDRAGVQNAESYGFPSGNIAIWETSVKGLYESEERLATSTTSYYLGRSAGVRETKSFYNMPVQNLNTSVVRNSLDELNPNEYELYPVFRKTAIKPFVEGRTGRPYRVGSTFYSLTKPEKIQNYKNVLVQEKLTGKVYMGDNARKILSLPDYEVTVNPATHPKFDLFIQSTSTNRNLVSGTQVIILK